MGGGGGGLSACHWLYLSLKNEWGGGGGQVFLPVVHVCS